MPYTIKGNTVVKKSTGKVVGKSADPKKYVRTLEAVSHEFVPRGKKKQYRMADGGVVKS